MSHQQGSNYQEQAEADEPTKLMTEKQIAFELKEHTRQHLLEICRLMDAATKHQMIINFSLGVNAYGQRFVQDLQVSKLL